MHLRTPSVTVRIQYTSNYKLLCWLPKCQSLCFRLQQERVPVVRILLRRLKIIADTAKRSEPEKVANLKKKINFRNREVLVAVADRLQSINLKFYALNQQVNLLFSLFIFVLRRKK